MSNQRKCWQAFLYIFNKRCVDEKTGLLVGEVVLMHDGKSYTATANDVSNETRRVHTTVNNSVRFDKVHTAVGNELIQVYFRTAEDTSRIETKSDNADEPMGVEDGNANEPMDVDPESEYTIDGKFQYFNSLEEFHKFLVNRIRTPVISFDENKNTFNLNQYMLIPVNACFEDIGFTYKTELPDVEGLHSDFDDDILNDICTHHLSVTGYNPV